MRSATGRYRHDITTLLHAAIIDLRDEATDIPRPRRSPQIAGSVRRARLVNPGRARGAEWPRRDRRPLRAVFTWKSAQNCVGQRSLTNWRDSILTSTCGGAVPCSRFTPTTPDAGRHFCTSARQMLSLLLESAAISETRRSPGFAWNGELSVADTKRISETTALRLAEQILARSMPSGWSAMVVQAPGRSAGSRSVSLRVRTSDGNTSEFGIVTKRSLNPMEAGQLLDTMGLEASTSLRGPKPSDVAIVAPYLSERTREVIAGRGVSYIDSTGNMRLQSNRPALYILTTGADKDPGPTTSHSSRYAAAAPEGRCAPSSTSALRTACENSPAAPTSPPPPLHE